MSCSHRRCHHKRVCHTKSKISALCSLTFHCHSTRISAHRWAVSSNICSLYTIQFLVSEDRLVWFYLCDILNGKSGTCIYDFKGSWSQIQFSKAENSVMHAYSTHRLQSVIHHRLHSNQMCFDALTVYIQCIEITGVQSECPLDLFSYSIWFGVTVCVVLHECQFLFQGHVSDGQVSQCWFLSQCCTLPSLHTVT